MLMGSPRRVSCALEDARYRSPPLARASGRSPRRDVDDLAGVDGFDDDAGDTEVWVSELHDDHAGALVDHLDGGGAADRAWRTAPAGRPSVSRRGWPLDGPDAWVFGEQLTEDRIVATV